MVSEAYLVLEIMLVLMTKMATRNMRTKLLIVLALGAFVGIVTMITTFSTTSAQTADISSLTAEEYKALHKSRAESSVTAALNHPTVKQHVNAAFKVATDFELSDNSDKITVKTWGTRTVSGDWRNGYLTSYKGGQIIEVLIDRNTNAVISAQVTPRPDAEETVTFTDNQKRILEIVMNDQRVKAELQGKIDDKDYWVQMVRDYNVGSRVTGHPIAIINIFSPDEKNSLSADFDLVTNQVTDVKSNFRQRGP